MPPGAIAACGWGCGVWVNHEAARDALLPAELVKSRLTTWFRERVPCPHCAAVMSLRGYDMALFQGCDEHGFWLDAETAGQTGLARPGVAPQVERAREAAKAFRVEQERREAEEREAREADDRARGEEWEAMSKKMRAAAEGDAERRRVAAAEESERRRLEALAWRRTPYVKLVRELVENHDLIPLADYLMQLEERLQRLEGILRSR
jgi:hypothetical protein